MIVGVNNRVGRRFVPALASSDLKSKIMWQKPRRIRNHVANIADSSGDCRKIARDFNRWRSKWIWRRRFSPPVLARFRRSQKCKASSPDPRLLDCSASNPLSKEPGEAVPRWGGTDREGRLSASLLLPVDIPAQHDQRRQVLHRWPAGDVVAQIVQPVDRRHLDLNDEVEVPADRGHAPHLSVTG